MKNLMPTSAPDLRDCAAPEVMGGDDAPDQPTAEQLQDAAWNELDEASAQMTGVLAGLRSCIDRDGDEHARKWLAETLGRWADMKARVQSVRDIEVAACVEGQR